MYDPLIGSTIDGRYTIEALLGQGGMGSVYAARHAIIDKRCAMKVLRMDHAAADPTAAQRFLIEAKAASKIGHQNIVDITDFGVLPEGQVYFVMEHLDGPTLGKVVHDNGHLQPARAITITVQIARGLSAAHDKDIIHRDLKPENIFVLEREGQSDLVKIVDFGIARDVRSSKRLTQVGMVLGTPEYMSPEQATGQPSDHRVDMYALGCILYEMLTGDVPFKGETPTRTLTMQVFDAPQPPSKRRPDLTIPASLEAVVMRMLQKKPQDRFTDLRELMQVLDRVDGEMRGRESSQPIVLSQLASPSAVAAARREPPSQPFRVPRKNRTPVIVAVSAVAGVVIFGIALALNRPPKKPLPSVAAQTDQTKPDKPKPDADKAHKPTEPVEVELSLRSRPSGAQILLDNEVLGTTPFVLHRPLGDTTIDLVFRRVGYRDETRSLVPSADKELEVVLERSAKAAKKLTASNSPPTQGNKTVKTHVSDLRNPFD